MDIRRFKESDFERVQDIYQQGIATGNATFQSQRKSWLQWQNSMLENTTLVITQGNTSLVPEVLGWAGLSAISSREVYSGVAEISIYVAADAAGRGVGKKLFKALIAHSESLDFWTLQAAIFPENTASIALHDSVGFKVIGRREALGKMQGVWRDVILLERRSTTVGL
ncbi:MAG: L-amino acid N-acyltransferase YncA [Oceanospirillaceae bacterium]|jgi:L-amino acid N-acyltransferase YncA